MYNDYKVTIFVVMYDIDGLEFLDHHNNVDRLDKASHQSDTMTGVGTICVYFKLPNDILSSAEYIKNWWYSIVTQRIHIQYSITFRMLCFTS